MKKIKSGAGATDLGSTEAAAELLDTGQTVTFENARDGQTWESPDGIRWTLHATEPKD